jgi:hypothetical protein
MAGLEQIFDRHCAYIDGGIREVLAFAISLENALEPVIFHDG